MTQVKIFDGSSGGKRGAGGCLRWLRRGGRGGGGGGKAWAKPRPPKAPRSTRAPATPGLLRRLACCGPCRRTAPRDSAEALAGSPSSTTAAANASTKAQGGCAGCLSKLRAFCCRTRRKDVGAARKAAPKPAADGEVPARGCCARGWSRFGGLARSACSALLCLNTACCLRSACRQPGGCCARCCPLPAPPEEAAGAGERRRSQARSLARGKSMTASSKELSKLDAALVEHNGVMRGAIPVLPLPLAWICMICNVFVPGLGTLSMGLFCLCVGKPRFSASDTAKARVGAFCLDTLVAASQVFTVLFCLVGWGWSIWWGLIALRLAKKYKRIQLAERAAATRPAAITVPAGGAGADVERGLRQGGGKPP